MIQLPAIKGGTYCLTTGYKGREGWFNCQLYTEGRMIQLPVVKGGRDGSTAGYTGNERWFNCRLERWFNYQL